MPVEGWIAATSAILTAGATIYLACVALKQMRHLERQHRDAVRFDIALKDMVLHENGQLEAWGIANLGQRSIIIKYVSLHDKHGHRIGHAFPPMGSIASGAAIRAERYLLQFNEAAVDVYDGIQPRIVAIDDARDQAEFVRLVFQAGGDSEVDHHVVLPKYRHRGDRLPVFSQVRRNILNAPRSNPRMLTKSHFDAVDTSDPRPNEFESK